MPSKKQSSKGLALQATRDDAKARKAWSTSQQLPGASTQLKGVTSFDSFANFAQKLGMGADNPLSTATYSFNPITRQRMLLEWMYRGSWIAGLAVDIIADDMTRAGIEFKTELPPDQSDKIDTMALALGIWNGINETIRWGRLYGGAVAVALIDGQDLRTPLRMDTVGPGQFKGLLVLDRWMLEPSMEDLVTEFGPALGTPRYYRVLSNAPALRGEAIHYTRIPIRHLGQSLPYQQALVEQLWGLSVYERLYDRMTMFDSATAGAGQLVYKSYLRTLKIKDMRSVVSAGGPALEGLMQYTELMRRYQTIEGGTMIDAEDDFDTQVHGAFSGLSDALIQFGQQLSGALQIPLTRLFGQSPAGLNSTGESDTRTYYDNIMQRQQKDLLVGVMMVYRLLAQSMSVPLPPGFMIAFRSLRELDEEQRATVAKTTAEAVSAALEQALISEKGAMQELRQSSRVTGIFTNITQEDIAAAESRVNPPPDPSELIGELAAGLNPPALPNDPNEGPPNGVRPQGQASSVPSGSANRVRVQRPFA